MFDTWFAKPGSSGCAEPYKWPIDAIRAFNLKHRHKQTKKEKREEEREEEMEEIEADGGHRRATKASRGLQSFVQEGASKER